MASWRRPVIVAGGNVAATGTGPQVRRLARALGAPVVFTRLGKGALADDDGLVAGHWRSPAGDWTVQQADGLLAVGCRFTQIDTAGWAAVLPDSRVQLDPDGEEIGREYAVDAGVVGSLGQSLPLLLEAVEGRGRAATDWLSQAVDKRRALQQQRPDLPLMADLRRALPAEAIVAADVTSFAYRAFEEFPVYQPRTFLYPCHYVTLGFGVPAAIGAKLACPQRPVVAFCGDGGFQMTACELSTAVQYGIGVVFAVVNDGCLSAIHGSHELMFAGRAVDTQMQTPHLAEMARAMGVHAVRVEGAEAFPAALESALQQPGPALVEVVMQDQRDEIIRQVPWLYPD